MDVTACPGCGASKFRVAGPPGAEIAVKAGAFTLRQPRYDIRCCATCGLYYKTPVPAWSEFRQYYDHVDFGKWEIPGLFPTEQAVLRVLGGLAAGSRILDFGCSTGRLLQRLTGRYECYGVEINRDAAAIAAGKGIRMLDDADLDAPGTPTFDAVVLSDVFEHLPNPTDALERLYRRLNPGGLLVVTTGNADAPACRRDPAGFWYFRVIEHVAMMSRRYAEFLARRLGATITAWERMSHYAPPLKTALKERAQNFAFWTFRDPSPSAARRVMRGVLRCVPVLRRAAGWTLQPMYTVTADHVVAAFQKPAVAAAGAASAAAAAQGAAA
jgi:SAM-dependent methyltransferase